MSRLKPDARNAWHVLAKAFLDQEPACDGDERFLQDELDNQDRFELQQICGSCPLLTECLSFAEVERPKGAWWPHQLKVASK